MKVFIITLFAAAFLSVEASPKPGGYTLKGGVNYKLQENKPVGHFNAAKAAGRFAQQHRLEEELQQEGSSFGAFNSKRSTQPQQVTFFTSNSNHAALTALAQDNANDQQFHQKRNTESYHKPLYYNEYHNRR